MPPRRRRWDMPTVRYELYDVFTAVPFVGNSLAAATVGGRAVRVGRGELTL